MEPLYPPKGLFRTPKSVTRAILMDGKIRRAAEQILKGGVVVFPTETVYGLGANAFDAKAVARIFEVKRRPRFNPLIVHVPGPESLKELVSEVPADAKLLMKKFWPGPLTLVLPKTDKVPGLVTSGLPSVGIRMPNHPIAQDLLKAAGVPIAAPSANRFTRLSSTCLSHAKDQLGDEVDMYLDGGTCSVGVESTIVTWIDGRATLLREGGTPKEAIEKLIGPLAAMPTHRPLAPGFMPRHYAPKTPLLFSEKPVVFDKKRRVGLIAFKDGDEGQGFVKVSYLSPEGDLRQAASCLFSKLHEMEELKLDLIVARPFPSQGLGLAINDRLRRAGVH